MLDRVRCMLATSLISLSMIAVRAEAAIVILDLTPIADTTIFEDEPGRASGQGEYAFVGNTAGGAARRALMRFDLGDFTPGSTVVSASLSIAVNRVPAGVQDGSTAVHRLQAAWGEGASDGGGGGSGAAAASGDATWSHRFWNTLETWTVDGGDFASTPTAVTQLAASGASTWSGPGLVADVQAWIDDPATNFGWILVGNEDLDRTSHRFFAAETAAGAVRPTLRIEVMPIPEPSTYATFGVGVLLLGFALGNHRRRR